MSLVNFLTGTRQQLENHAIQDGAVYYLPGEENNGRGTIAYDLEGVRSWITTPKILTVSELDNSIPLKGELIVVTDALSTIDENNVTTYYPALKIGNGSTALNVLPYLDDYHRVQISALYNLIDDLNTTVNSHINNTAIHHTVNGVIHENQDDDAYTLEVLNYN